MAGPGRRRLSGIALVAGTVLLLVGTVVAPDLLAGSSRDPSPGAPVARGGCPVHATPATAARCGLEVARLVAVTALPGGGTADVYHLPGGTTVSVRRPPKGFSPTRANPSQLAEYGFPARPRTSDPARSAAWRALVNHDVFAPAPRYLLTGEARGGACTAYPGYRPYQCGESSAATGNWSGVVDTEPSAGYFQSVTAQYTEPTTAPSHTCGSSVAAFWTGLGGYHTGSLAQDGTTEGFCGVPDGSMWWEVVPANPSMVFPGGGDVTAPGDLVGTSVTYLGDGQYSMYVKDLTTSVTFSAIESGAGSTFDGSTAEVVAERPLKVSTLSNFPLEDFGGLSVENSFAQGGVGNLSAPVGLWNFVNVTVVNGIRPLATVTRAPRQLQSAKGGFLVSWQASS